MEVTELVQATDQRLRESGIRSVDELQRLPYNVVGFSEDMHRRNRQLKDFLYSKLYRHYRVVRMAVKAERVISDLCSAPTRQNQRYCPKHIQDVIEKRGLGADDLRLYCRYD
jgi:dGTPase